MNTVDFTSTYKSMGILLIRYVNELHGLMSCDTDQDVPLKGGAGN